MLWRIEIPCEPVKAVERWLEGLGHQISEPASRVKILSIPDTFDSETREPRFTYGNPIVAKVIIPYPGSTSLLTLHFDSNRIAVPVHSDSKGREVFFEISLAAPGEYSLEVDTERYAVTEFHCHKQQKISDLRRSLSQLPRLRLSVGEAKFAAWSDQPAAITTDSLKTTPVISVDLGVERLWIDLDYTSGGQRIVRLRLSPRAAEQHIKEFLTKQQPGSLRIDAGALGSINLSLITPEKEDCLQPESRIAHWLACVSAARPDRKTPAMNPATFRGTAGNPRLAFASMQNVDPALAAQIRSVAKERGRVRRRHKR
jgi:hypothetical protein